MLNKFDFRTELGKKSPRIAKGAKVYVWGCGANWESICKMFKHLVDVNIDDCIDGFIDSDVNKQGTMFHSKQIYAISDIDTDNSVILISIASQQANTEILSQLLNFNIYEFNSVFAVNYFFILLMHYEYDILLQFKGKHKGKRCFIIGNGPSLLASDLDRLKDEITFATNKIYLMFDKTKWRPSYYICLDTEVFEPTQNQISKYIECPAFCPIHTILYLDNLDLTNFFYFCLDSSAFLRPDMKATFSEEMFISQWGGTVSYNCMQFAAYMGFNEIYLLGMDNTFMRGVKLNGEIEPGNSPDKNHFAKEYTSACYWTSKIDAVDAAYKTAREYCEQHNIKIRNATRGGALEIFERVDFDSLL
jgi:hypothetical protein